MLPAHALCMCIQSRSNPLTWLPLSNKGRSSDGGNQQLSIDEGKREKQDGMLRDIGKEIVQDRACLPSETHGFLPGVCRVAESLYSLNRPAPYGIPNCGAQQPASHVEKVEEAR